MRVPNSTRAFPFIQARQPSLPQLLVTAIVLIASTLTLVGRAAPASAEIPGCASVHSNYFDGFYYDTNAYQDSWEGSSAYIVNRFGAVCDFGDTSAPDPGSNTIGTNFTTGWVMIAAANGIGWSQDGFIRGYNSPQYEWAQVYDGKSTIYNMFPSSPTLADGDVHAYRELYNAANGTIESSIDGQVFAVTNFNPFQTWNTAPNGSLSPQFSGETTYNESDVPGVSSSQTAFSALGAQSYIGDSLVSMPCELTYNNKNPRWSHSASSCIAFNIWTENT